MAGEGNVNPAVERYLDSLLPARDEVLEEMERQAAQRDIPIVGPAVARVLYQYARLINAKKIFELGSAIGYSTLWWARGGRRRTGVLHRWRLEERKRSPWLLSPRRGGRSHSHPGRRRAGTALRTETGIRHHLQRCGQRRLPACAPHGQQPPSARRTFYHRQRVVVYPCDRSGTKNAIHTRCSGIQPAALRHAGILHNHRSHPRRSFRRAEKLN